MAATMMKAAVVLREEIRVDLLLSAELNVLSTTQLGSTFNSLYNIILNNLHYFNPRLRRANRMNSPALSTVNP